MLTCNNYVPVKKTIDDSLFMIFILSIMNFFLFIVLKLFIWIDVYNLNMLMILLLLPDGSLLYVLK